MANLLHFIHRFPPAPGGAEFVAQQVCARLMETGHPVRVETTNALGSDSFHRFFSETLPTGHTCVEGIPVKRHRCFRLPMQRYLLGFAQRVAPVQWKPWLNWYSPLCPGLGSGSWSGEFIPDGIVVWALPHGSVWASAQRLAQSLRLPLIAIPLLHPGNPRDSRCPIRTAFRQPWLVQLLRQAMRVIALTSWEKQELSSLGINPEIIRVAPLGLPPDGVNGGDRDSFRRALNISIHDKVVGHLATLSKDKGTLDLLEARRRIPAPDGPILVLAGDQTEPVKRHLKQIGKPSWLRVLGRLSREQKKDFFAGIDLLCLPSLVDSWSLTLMEGWSAAKGAIVYDAGGPGELVRHGVDGWKIIPGDIQEIASVLARTQNQQGFFNHWGQAGIARISVEFDWNQAIDRLSGSIIQSLPLDPASR